MTAKNATPQLRFHHVGIGTTSFEDAIRVYESLGYTCTHNVDDSLLNARLATMEAPGSPTLEIVGSLGDNGPLKPFITRRQLPSPYHTCYEVDDINLARTYLISEKGFIPVGPVVPALVFGGRMIAYHYHAATGLLELIEARIRR